MTAFAAIVRIAAIAAACGLAIVAAAHAASPPPADPGTRLPAGECEVIHGLTALDRAQRERLHHACTQGPEGDAATYTALFRLVSSSGWHAGVVGTILRRHHRASLTAWADGGTHDPPPALVAQERIEAGLRGFADGTQCPELRNSEEIAAFLDAVGADEAPEGPPFTSRFASCLGVPASAMESTRLLTIRADGLEDVTVVVGTRDFVHARRWSRDEALRLGGHRFFVVAVPEASPVVALGTHENQALPVVWRGLVTRNEVIWAAAPRRSCLDLSVRMNPGTRLYFDGVRIDDGADDEVCAAERGSGGETLAVDRTLAITLDHPGSGLPEHEISALTCEGEGKRRRPVVRHLSPLPATAPADELRAAGLCEAFRLDLGTPTKQRVAVLGVTKLPGCEATPLWASDVPERVRHVLGRDAAHQRARSYTNFSAYAEASEALSTLESRMGGQGEAAAPERDADANALLGSAAQEAWRQGIDTLLSLTVQCTPRGRTKGDEPQWAYSIRATSIHVSGLFARGYYGREGLDLEDFIGVESVGFDAAEQQDAAIGALLDRTFGVSVPRFVHRLAHVPYRRPQTLRVAGWFDGLPDEGEGEGEDEDPAEDGGGVPETIEVRYKAFDEVGQRLFDFDRRRVPGHDDRPRPCEGLVSRGARLPEAMQTARAVYAELPGKERAVVLERSRDDVDASSDPRATVHEGELFVPRPGWYLVKVDADDDGRLDDAVCIDATSRAIDPWVDLAPSGGPLAFARNGSRARFYLRGRVGMTRYLRGGWLGGGVSLGYGFTDYAGTRADWKDLDVAVKDPLQWRRHSILLSPHIEARSRATVLPVEFRARLGPAFDSGVVELSRVDPDLSEFRVGSDEDVILDLDVDANLDLSMGVPAGPVQVELLLMVSYVAIDDTFVRTATTVVEDANLYLGFGMMISGGRR